MQGKQSSMEVHTLSVVVPTRFVLLVYMLRTTDVLMNGEEVRLLQQTIINKENLQD